VSKTAWPILSLRLATRATMVPVSATGCLVNVGSSVVHGGDWSGRSVEALVESTAAQASTPMRPVGPIAGVFTGGHGYPVPQDLAKRRGRTTIRLARIMTVRCRYCSTDRACSFKDSGRKFTVVVRNGQSPGSAERGDHAANGPAFSSKFSFPVGLAGWTHESRSATIRRSSFFFL